MDKLQQYLIEHPDIARTYAIIWNTILDAYPQVKHFTHPEQWDAFLHENVQTINSHLAKKTEIDRSQIHEAGEMMWYYGPAALSAPVQEAIAVYEGKSEASQTPSDEEKEKASEKKKKDSEEKAEDREHSHAHAGHYDTEIAEGTGQQTQKSSMSISEASAAIAAAKASAPPTKQEQIAQLLDAAKAEAASSSGLITRSGAPLISTSSQLPSSAPGSDQTADTPPEEAKTQQYFEDGTPLASETGGNYPSSDHSPLILPPFKRKAMPTPAPSVSSENGDNDESSQDDTAHNGNHRNFRPRRKSSLSPRRLLGGGGRGARVGGALLRAGVAAGGSFFASPPGLVILGIAGAALIILILLMIILKLQQDNAGQGVTVTLKKSGPAEVKNGEDIKYTLNVSYTGSPNSIIVEDLIPENAEFASASGDYKLFDESGKETSDPKLARKVIWTFLGSGGSSGSGGNESPSSDTCGGKYDLSGNFVHREKGDVGPKMNFGDPSCTFNKDDLYTLLKKEDPSNADFWFTKVVPCESQLIPNAWRDPNRSPQTPDPGGAWGLYQTGSSVNGPGKEGDGRGGPYDRGDVPWQKQTTNAISLQKERGWGYWHCANINL